MGKLFMGLILCVVFAASVNAHGGPRRAMSHHSTRHQHQRLTRNTVFSHDAEYHSLRQWCRGHTAQCIHVGNSYIITQ
jgi:hypothetical protein